MISMILMKRKLKIGGVEVTCPGIHCCKQAERSFLVLISIDTLMYIELICEMSWVNLTK